VAGISISLLSDVRDFLRGTRDASTGIEEVGDSLDDLVTDARTSAGRMGDELGDETRQGARDAERSLERVEDSFRDLASRARRETGEASDALARNTQQGTSRARRDLEELGSEARQNAAETFSSFDGSAESFADGIQGTLGGIVSSLGPIGAAAGAAGAIGIGLIMAAMDASEQRNEDYKESVAELAAEYIETGNVGAASLEFLADRMKALATETDDGKVSLSDIYDVAKRSGSSFRDLAEAYSGSAEELAELTKRNDDYLEQLRKEADAVDTTAKGGAQKYSSLIKQIDAQEKYNGYLAEASSAAKDAAEQQAQYAAAGGPEMEAKAEAIGSIQDAVDDAAGSWEDYQDKESGAVDPAAYLAGLQARLEAASSYADNLAVAQSKLDPAAYQYLVDQGIDFAPMLAAILAGGDEMITNFNNTFTTAAEAGKSAVEDTLPDEFDVTAKVDADTTEAETKTKETEKKPRETTVKAKADTKQAETDLAAVASKGRTATITAAASTYAADVALDNLTATRYADIIVNLKDRNGKTIEW